MTQPNGDGGDGGEGERLYGLSAGHVLTESDVRDIHNLLADYSDEIEKAANVFHEGARDAIYRIGGKDLLARWDTLFEREVDAAVTKAKAYIDARMAEFGRSH